MLTPHVCMNSSRRLKLEEKNHARVSVFATRAWPAAAPAADGGQATTNGKWDLPLIGRKHAGGGVLCLALPCPAPFQRHLQEVFFFSTIPIEPTFSTTGDKEIRLQLFF